MKLELETVTLNHFKSYLKPTTFKLKREPGLHFVCGDNEMDPQLGSNGSGKSTLWDALCWCLYGRTPAGLRNPDVKSWDGEDTTSVEVHLSINDKHYRVDRSISPNRLLVNGKVIGQESLDRVLGMTFHTFTNTVLLGQARPLFLDLTSRGKMELFREVLELERWEERAKMALAATLEMSGRMQKVDKKVAVLEGSLTQTQAVLEELRVKSDAWLKERESRVQNNEVELAKLREELAQATAKKDKWDLALDGALTELRPLQKQLRNLNITYQHILARSFNLRDALRKGAKCPTCGQVIKGHAEQRRHLEKELHKVSKDVDAQLKSIKRLEDAEKQFQQKSDEAQLELNRISPIVGALEAKIEALEKDSRKENSESNPLMQQIRALKRVQAETVRDIEELKKRSRKYMRMAERRHFWVKGFKEVELYLVDDVLRELELTINGMLPQSGLQDWSVAFSLERETQAGTIQRGIDVTILCPDMQSNGRAVRWESWSGGEGQRLRVIGSLALSEVLLQRAGVIPNVEILDEPTQHLSLEGVVDLCDYLGDRAERLQRAIFYTDQQSVEGTQFASVTTIAKSADGSRIVDS